MSDADSLAMGTESHYLDARYYDQTYRRRRDDVRFYVRCASRLLGSAPGPVLELGVGSGRVALALANEGHDVLGVDTMEPMLEQLRDRMGRVSRRVSDRITLHRADLRDLDLGRTFPLIISPFHVFNHLYELGDLERALAAVRAHLAPGGTFVFDVRHPDAAELARDPERVYKGRDVSRDGRRYRYRERYDYDPVRQIQTVEMAFVGVDDPSDFELQLLTHRCFFPAELRALLTYNGFEILEHLGDFDGEPLDETHDTQVLLCR